MNLIALVDCRWGIAKDGRQIFTIPGDLKRFKSLTMGSPIVLGRKTLLNFPDGKPLPGRENYILSKKIGTMDGAIVCRDVSEIPEEVLKNGWCVGGESVYRQLLPYCDTAFITWIDSDFGADQFLHPLEGDWQLCNASKVKEYNGTRYRFRTYKRGQSNPINSETLCWRCRRPGTSACEWDKSKGALPVKGWTANPTIRYGGTRDETQSYYVISCPKFIPDKRRQKIKNLRLSPEIAKEIDMLLLGGEKVRIIAQKFGVTTDTVYKRRRKLF